MNRPICSLCHRVGAECVYPQRRNFNRQRRANQDRRQSRSETTGERQIASPQEQAGSVSSQWGNGSTDARRRTPEEAPNDEDQRHSSPSERRSAQGAHLSSSPVDMTLAESWNNHTTNSPLHLASLGTPYGRNGPVFGSHMLDPSTSFPGYSPADDPDSAIIWESLIEDLPHVQTAQAQNDSFQTYSFTEIAGDDFDKQTWLNVDMEFANHLIDVYFDKVQCFLPLLCRPKLFAKLFGPYGEREKWHQELDLETALLLNAMFSLSARFSNWHVRWPTEFRERGRDFADKARMLASAWAKGDQNLSLLVLQGHILLAYHELTGNPNGRAWLATGLCCRIAYGLFLHEVDRNQCDPGDDQNAWAELEEKRRAWWIVFQLDNCMSVIASRPCSIDEQSFQVALPMSDATWDPHQQPRTAKLSFERPSEAWKILKDTNNSDSYAWFIACNFLHRLSMRQFIGPNRSIDRLRILQSTLHCFVLSFSNQFRPHASVSVFNEQTFQEQNWVTCTMILLQSAQVFVSLSIEMETVLTEPLVTCVSPSSNTTASTRENSPRSKSLYHRANIICSQYRNERIRAIMRWSPDFIPLACPLSACSLIGPAAILALQQQRWAEQESQDTPSEIAGTEAILHELNLHVIELTLDHFARYWGIGDSMRQLFRDLGTRPNEVSLERTWVKGLIPSILQTCYKRPS